MRRASLAIKIPLFACIFFLCGFSSAYAASKVVYTIKKGDNLHEIAKKYNVSVDEIKSGRKLNPRNLKPGTKIIIPVHKAAEKKSLKAVRSAKDSPVQAKKDRPEKPDAVEAGPAAAKADNLYHTVNKGDTLSSISRKYSLPAGELKALNNLKSTRLKKGQKLLVKRIGPKTYAVKKGDNLWKIARKFDMDADDLMELNEMGSPSLSIGQTLYLEEKVDHASARVYQEAVVSRNLEEEIRSISESEEFSEKDPPGKLVTFAKKLLNIPYKFGGNSIRGIDCSGYVKKVYGLLGVELPRTAREQYQTGEAIEKDELSIGDLVFFRTYASFPSHVGIYLGNNLFIHASSKGKKVTIDSLETPYYLKRFIGGKRLLTEGEHAQDPNG